MINFEIINAFIYVFLIFHFFLVYFMINNIETQFEKECFIAGVYEHFRFDNKNDSKLTNPHQIVKKNLEDYSKVAKLASNYGVDILLFPESGLFNENDRNAALFFLEYIPRVDQKINLCKQFQQQTNSELNVVGFLSCLAKKYSLFLDVNVGEIQDCNFEDSNCPQDNRYQFNTRIVFNKNGELIAKYRKHHLYFESQYDHPKQPEIVSFQTPFGTFGIVTCFDAFFEQPLNSLVKDKNIDSLLFSSWWFDEFPFLLAPQFQHSIALTKRINVLASNINLLERGSVGSGIYSSKGFFFYSHETNKGGSKLILSYLPKSNKKQVNICKKLNMIIPIGDTFQAKYQFMKINFSEFQSVKLTEQSDYLKICNGPLCCFLNYTLSDQYFKNVYFLVSLKRIRPKLNLGEEGCGMIAYNLDVNSYSLEVSTFFKSIELSGNFTTQHVFPSVLTNQLQLFSTSNWNFFSNSLNSYSIQISNQKKPIVSVGIYARCFDQDKNA